MELWQEILAYILSREQAQITFPNITVNPSALIEDTCYQALLKIKQILENKDLDDPECFLRIEKIICVLESYGCFCGLRHDF